MEAPSSPSERKRVMGVKDRSPDLRLASTFPESARWAYLQWLIGTSDRAKVTKLTFLAVAIRTAIQASALTVAGQWRSFTAFPNILTIAVVWFAARTESSRDDMKQTFMSSMVINATRREVKTTLGLESRAD